MTSSRNRNELSRRGFLKQTGVASAGLGLGAALGAGASEAPIAPTKRRIQQRVKLGKTDLVVPDISFGTFSLESDERLVQYALDRGITHFDTAESYAKGLAEETLGRALAGRRQDVTLTTKFWAEAHNTAEHQMRVLEESLKRLRTDYIDLYMNHAVNDVARLRSEEWQAFAEKAKSQGKIRYLGMSGHAGRLGECVEYTLDENLVDVLLVAYSFAQQPSFKESLKSYLNTWLPDLDIVSSQPRLPELLDRAHAQGVGVMVMKTLKGARLNDMREFEMPNRTFAQAAFRWVLSEEAVDALVVTMTSTGMIDEYVEASGSGAPDREDLALLARYTARNARSTCTIGCGDCSAACPAGVPIADIMRTRMYDVDYQLPEAARRSYAELAIGAEACLSCSGLPCANACTTGLDIPKLNRDTARRLSTERVVRES